MFDHTGVVKISSDDLRRLVRAALARLDLGNLVRSAVREATDQRPGMSEGYRLEHAHHERTRAVRIARDTAWDAVIPMSAGAPGCARGAELRSVLLFGQVVSLPVQPGTIRR